MRSSKDIKTKWPNILLQGLSGVGKTHYLGTVSKHKKLLILDCESGLATIRGCEFNYEEIFNFKEFENAIEWYMLNAKKHKFDYLVMDSISRLQALLYDSIVKTGQKASFDDFALLLAKLRKICELITRKFPTPVIVTTMVSMSKDEVTGGYKLFPTLSGSFKAELNGYFDITLMLMAGLDKNNKTKYWSQTQSDRTCNCKSRYQPLEREIPSDFKTIMKLMESQK